VSEEINSIIEEINEELKNDQLMAFLKKHRDSIIGIVVITVIGILAYSSWYSRRNQQMAEITNALVDVLQSPTVEKHLMMGKLIENAPSELIPLLTILKLGRGLASFKDMPENSKALLGLTKKRGIDVIWKDLATIIYVSYGLRTTNELIELLKPLVEKERPFRFMAMEFMAMNYQKMGNYKKAEEILSAIIADSEAQKTLKKRISILLNFIKNNSEKK
jgi:hypothetical protein